MTTSKFGGKISWARRSVMATAFVAAGAVTLGVATAPAHAQYYGGYSYPYYGTPNYAYQPYYGYGYGYGYPGYGVGFGWGGGWHGGHGWGGGWHGGWGGGHGGHR